MAKINHDIANARIDNWGTDRLQDLKNEIDALGIKHASYSSSPRAARAALTKTNRKADGLINRISYRIPRHMIFVHKGVGRGTPIDKVGTTSRKAKPWFNPVIEKHIDELADIAAEELGSSIVNNLLIK